MKFFTLIFALLVTLSLAKPHRNPFDKGKGKGRGKGKGKGRGKGRGGLNPRLQKLADMADWAGYSAPELAEVKGAVTKHSDKMMAHRTLMRSLVSKKGDSPDDVTEAREQMKKLRDDMMAFEERILQKAKETGNEARVRALMPAKRGKGKGRGGAGGKKATPPAPAPPAPPARRKAKGKGKGRGRGGKGKGKGRGGKGKGKGRGMQFQDSTKRIDELRILIDEDSTLTSSDRRNFRADLDALAEQGRQFKAYNDVLDEERKTMRAFFQKLKKQNDPFSKSLKENHKVKRKDFQGKNKKHIDAHLEHHAKVADLHKSVKNRILGVPAGVN